MARFVIVATIVALVTGAVGSAAPPPGRTEALSDLQGAIDDERRMIELLRKEPPRLGSVRDRHLSAVQQLRRVIQFATTVQLPPTVERNLNDALDSDFKASNSLAYGATSRTVAEAIAHLEEALRLKTLAVPGVRSATAPAGTPQCSDGKDNDGDGIVDWKLDPGCTSARDIREGSPFSCEVESRIASGRLALSGSCSGPFSEVEFTLLDDVQLNGRYDIMHAPSCGAATVRGVRCKTKEGDKNPEHLIDARFSTTSKDPSQRVQLRFFDIRKRQIGRFVVPLQ